jgi:hypothetical protein
MKTAHIVQLTALCMLGCLTLGEVLWFVHQACRLGDE